MWRVWRVWRCGECGDVESVDPGGGTSHILGTGTCHREGYRFSRDFGIRNGIDFHDFGIRNGIDFHDFGVKYKVLDILFSANWV